MNAEKSLLLVVAVLIAGCGFSSPEVDWYYTIPHGYEGFLVIRYECDGGRSLMVDNGEVHLEFDEDGTACIADKFRASHGQVFAQDSQGQPIRVVGSPWNEEGYALYGQGTRGVERYGIDYGTFEILWVGDLEYLAKYYLQGLDQFLEDRFGVPQVD